MALPVSLKTLFMSSSFLPKWLPNDLHQHLHAQVQEHTDVEMQTWKHSETGCTQMWKHTDMGKCRCGNMQTMGNT